MNSVGLIPKILTRASEAQQPVRFTQDFLGTKLGLNSGSARPVIPLLKRLGLLQSDGTPTPLYSRFRNPSEQGGAMAEAIRHGYSDVFERNEYAHELSREKFRDLVVEITGLPRNNSSVQAIVGTFQALKEFANFDAARAPGRSLKEKAGEVIPPPGIRDIIHGGNVEGDPRLSPDRREEVSMNLSYTINLNLPESANPEVFNAIFKALKEHLLRR